MRNPVGTRGKRPLPDVGSKQFGSGAASTAIRQNAAAKLTFGNRESGPAKAGIPAGTREGAALDHGQEHPRGGETRSPEHLRHERLVALLRDVAARMGKVRAAEALGDRYLKPAPVWELIGRRNMSQNELARKAGISSGYLSQLISWRKSPSPDVRRRLQAALEVDCFEDIFVMEYGDD